MNYRERIRRSFRSSRGLFDLQSIMVGIVVSAIVSSVAIVSIVGVTRLIGVDSGKMTLATLSVAMEAYYSENDKYPANMAELANGNYVSKNYATMDNFCLAVPAGSYPQTYEAAVYISSTKEVYFSTQENRNPTKELDLNNFHCLS